MWANVCVSREIVDLEKFWSAVKVYIEKPHTVNRRLIGVDSRSFLCFSGECLSEESLDELVRSTENVGSTKFVKVLKENWKDCKAVEEILWESLANSLENSLIILRKLLPKQVGKFGHVEEAVVIGKRCAVFYKVSEISTTLIPAHVYRFLLTGSSGISLDVFADESIKEEAIQSSGISWLKETVLPKIVKWATKPSCTGKGLSLSSLSLIPLEKYCVRYHHLKKKYGKKLVEIWPEKTDPLKFVYEDVGIAAYLLTFWDSVSPKGKKPSFLDIGCGNGLLVYILSSEGYPGIGIDIRRRKIWDLYGSNTKLQEAVITPDSRYPDYEWWIGNHSDELTPWIPLLAARSSYHSKVFLLPCCPFTFDGKYQRRHGNVSQYQSFLKFLQELLKEVGFSYSIDKLRIPSTKRICFVCPSKNYDATQEAQMESQRSNFVRSYSKKEDLLTIKVDVNKKDHDTNTEDLREVQVDVLFQPREKVEKVQNCTSLDRQFLDEVVCKLGGYLLRSTDNSEKGADVWYKGASVPIKELVDILSKEELKELKSQCGGLQTLLKNNSHVFKVFKGIVSINKPEDSSLDIGPASKKPKTVKKKECWFHKHHPQGCPLPEKKCLFIHV